VFFARRTKTLFLIDLADLAVFASLEGFTFLSLQPPPDRVHTVGFLMVVLTFTFFLSSPPSCHLTRLTLGCS
jgi:hypothetical protein